MPSHQDAAQTALKAGAFLEHAALAPANYVTAFDGVRQILGARTFYMARLRADGTLDFLADRDAFEPIRDYQDNDWEERDTWSHYAQRASRDGQLMTDSMLVPAQLRERDSFFQDYCRKWDLGHFLAWRTNLLGETWVNTLIRPAGDPFRPEELRALEAFRLAADRAALLACAFRGAQAKGLAEGLECSGRPSLVLDHHGRVIFVTSRVARFVDRAFAIRCGILAGFDNQTEAHFAALRSAILRRSASLPAPFPIASPSLAKPIVAIPVPMQDDFAATLPGANALLMLVDTDDRPRVASSTLRSALSLSKREADLGQLLGQGMTMPEAAEQLGIRLSSARQLAKTLLAKSGYSRQSELVAFIQRLAVQTGADEDGRQAGMPAD